ncbi:hypothetical protein [Paenibacillus gorillae]|uniref:hypothetical protein n=1 Tax=Paenibacillus gorillae TaxID=1243662 RepID=UPI001EE3469B|nr:hypothetical protein [Paenibacillus gorillae]
MLKYRFSMMFLILLGGMISIAAFNPIIGPLSRNLGLSDFQSGCLVSIAGLCWLLGGYFWEKQTFLNRKMLLASIMLVYLVALIIFALLADYAVHVGGGHTSSGVSSCFARSRGFSSEVFRLWHKPMLWDGPLRKYARGVWPYLVQLMALGSY